MKIFSEFPKTKPNTPLLDTVNNPNDLRRFSKKELQKFSDELREFLIYSVSQSGGHFGAGLVLLNLQ